MLKSLWNQLIPTRSCLQRCILGFCNLPTTTTTRRRLSFHKGNLIEFSLSHSYDFWHYVATPFEVASSPFLPAGEAGHICNTIRQSAPNQHDTEGWGYKFTTSSIYIYIPLWFGRILNKFLIPMLLKTTPYLIVILLSHHLFTQLPTLHQQQGVVKIFR